MQILMEPEVWVEIINKGTLAFVAVVAMIVGGTCPSVANR